MSELRELIREATPCIYFTVLKHVLGPVQIPNCRVSSVISDSPACKFDYQTHTHNGECDKCQPRASPGQKHNFAHNMISWSRYFVAEPLSGVSLVTWASLDDVGGKKTGGAQGCCSQELNLCNLVKLLVRTSNTASAT
jgi:hypothetical protein